MQRHVIIQLVLWASCVSVNGQHPLPVDSTGQVRFGPQNCVRVSKSEGGSCVISTSCKGLDTSTTEFVFDCIKRHTIERHSFGVGGFESFEEFDSEIKCDKCAHALKTSTPLRPPSGLMAQPDKSVEAKPAALPHKHSSRAPSPPFGFQPLTHLLPTKAPKSKVKLNAVRHEEIRHKHHHKKASHHEHHTVHGAVGFRAKLRVKHQQVHTAKTGAHASVSSTWPWSLKKEDKPKIVKYGPKDCVSTYKNKRGECVVKTECAGVDISGYNFGLTCVDKAGVPVKHVFGKGSFDAEETFETLISCDKCLGLQEIPESGKDKSALSQVEALHDEIKGLTNVLLNISANVNTLNAAVFKGKGEAGAPGPAPAGVGAAPASAKAKAKASVLIQAHLPLRQEHQDSGIHEEQKVSTAAKSQHGEAKASQKQEDAEEENEFDADSDDDDEEEIDNKDAEVPGKIATQQSKGPAKHQEAVALKSKDDDEDEDEDEDDDDAD